MSCSRVRARQPLRKQRSSKSQKSREHARHRAMALLQLASRMCCLRAPLNEGRAAVVKGPLTREACYACTSVLSLHCQPPSSRRGLSCYRASLAGGLSLAIWILSLKLPAFPFPRVSYACQTTRSAHTAAISRRTAAQPPHHHHDFPSIPGRLGQLPAKHLVSHFPRRVLSHSL